MNNSKYKIHLVVNVSWEELAFPQLSGNLCRQYILGYISWFSVHLRALIAGLKPLLHPDGSLPFCQHWKVAAFEVAKMFLPSVN